MNTKLKTAREKKGLHKTAIAKITGIATMTYFRYESGERVPDAHTAIRIAEALETTVEELFKQKK